jgi:adenylate cyclase
MVGNPVRQINYTALGHTVVVSARLQTLAEGGEVVVSDTVQQEAQWLFTMDGGDPVQVKGVTEPVCAYRVLAQKNGGAA